MLWALSDGLTGSIYHGDIYVTDDYITRFFLDLDVSETVR